MKKSFKFLNIFLVAIMAISIFSFPASAASGAKYDLGFDVNAKAYIVVSLDTGETVFEKDADRQYTPASLTKLMTAYVVMKNVEDLDGTMVTAPASVYDELYGTNSSTADIRKGETLSVRQLLYALLLPSANEAANILADYVGNGYSENFYMMMNSEAQKLGCTNTHFSSAHGLFAENNYTSARDMYLIAKACYETPGFMDIVQTTRYQLPANTKHDSPYYILSTVKMQNPSSPYYRSYVHGMKTGSLDEIGHNFVSLCQQNGESYICVVIGADKSEDPGAAFTTTAGIMDYFFANYSMRNANNSAYPVTEVPVKYSADADTVLLYADTPVMAILPNDADESSFQKVYNLPESVSAPINEGDVIGTVDYYLAGEKIGTSQLVSHDTIERNFVMFVVGKFRERYQSLYFRVVLCVTAVLLIGYGIMCYVHFKKNEKIQKVRRSR